MVFQRWMGRREKKAFWIKAHEKFERIIKTIPLKKWLLFTMEIFVDEGEEKKRNGDSVPLLGVVQSSIFFFFLFC